MPLLLRAICHTRRVIFAASMPYATLAYYAYATMLITADILSLMPPLAHYYTPSYADTLPRRRAELRYYATPPAAAFRLSADAATLDKMPMLYLIRCYLLLALATLSSYVAALRFTLLMPPFSSLPMRAAAHYRHRAQQRRVRHVLICR